MELPKSLVRIRNSKQCRDLCHAYMSIYRKRKNGCMAKLAKYSLLLALAIKRGFITGRRAWLKRIAMRRKHVKSQAKHK